MATGRFKSFVKNPADVSQAATAQVASMARAIAGESKIGRPAGKRTDPAFRQVSAWLRKDTYGKVRARLFEAGEGREFSELVQDLLEKWLQEKKSSTRVHEDLST